MDVFDKPKNLTPIAARIELVRDMLSNGGTGCAFVLDAVLDYADRVVTHAMEWPPETDEERDDVAIANEILVAYQILGGNDVRS